MSYRTSLALLFSVSLVVLALVTSSARAESPAAESPLTGLWCGEPVHNGQSGHVALRVKRDAEGRTIGLVSMLDIDVRDLPFGLVEIESNEVSVGPLKAVWNPEAGTLSGTMPDAIVPVYSIPFTLRRCDALPTSGPTPDAPVATPRWTFDAGAAVWGGLRVLRGTLVFGTESGAVLAIDTSTGDRKWKFETAGAVRSRPEPAGDDVIVVSDDGFAYRLAADDGTLRWKTRLGDPIVRPGPGDPSYNYDSYTSSPTLHDDAIFVGSGSDVIALDAASGKERWRHATGGAVQTKPAAGNGLVFAGSFDGKLYALDALSGDAAWSHDFGAAVTSSPAVADGRVITGSRSYDLAAFETGTGRQLWNDYTWFSWIESSPTVVENAIYVGSSDAQALTALEADSGRRVWRADTGGSAWAQPAVSGNRVYLGSVGVARYIVDHRATFWAFDRNSGRPVWRFDESQPDNAAMWGFTASPAVDGTGVYVATLHGSVYAFEK